MNLIRRHIVLITTIITIWLIYHTPRLAQPPSTPCGGRATCPIRVDRPTFRFKPGKVKPPGEKYTKTIVIASLKSDDTTWIHRTYPNLDKYIYLLDAPALLSNALAVPANRGREAMAYLTYLIDQYTNLSDTTIFLRGTRFSNRDNNAVLNADLGETIALLNDAHVARVGYFNARCHLDPGCPDGLHLDQSVDIDGSVDGVAQGSGQKAKGNMLSFTLRVWRELFPDVAEPGMVLGMGPKISQPGGAQFAVSRERIRARPVEDYIRYRDWLMTSELDDDVLSGLFEYSWQTVFAGTHALCPKTADCYCEGFGICFQDEGDLDRWMGLLERRNFLQDELKMAAGRGVKGDGEGGDSLEAKFLRERMGWYNDEMIKRRRIAWERGSRWIGRDIKKNLL